MCFNCTSFYIGYTANDIWNKIPDEFDAYKLVKIKSADWDMLGKALKVPENERIGLSRDQSKGKEGKLDSVVNYWLMSRCSPPTFENLREVVLGLGWQAVAEGIEEFVANHKNIDKYKGKKTI